MKTVVVQMGARHNYAYAVALAQTGALQRLVTDYCRPLSSSGAALPLRKGAALRRRVGIEASLLRSTPLANLAGILVGSIGRRWRHDVEDQVLGLRALHDFRAPPDYVISVFGSGGKFLWDAKRLGARIVTDMIIVANHLEIERAEQLKFPGWETRRILEPEVHAMRRRVQRMVSVSDILLCPSSAVSESLKSFEGFSPENVLHLPYPVPLPSLGVSKPVRGRVLFAGTVGLRKGIQYMIEAARMLQDVPFVEFVVAGGDPYKIGPRFAGRNMTFLGHLSRSEIYREYSRADVFCLPSLAEGSAGVIAEAMSAGIPVITTAAAGSLVRQGVDGLIVPERSGRELAEAIKKIVSDRKLRTEMSQAAKESSVGCEMELWAGRLVAALSNWAR